MFLFLSYIVHYSILLTNIPFYMTIKLSYLLFSSSLLHVLFLSPLLTSVLSYPNFLIPFARSCFQILIFTSFFFLLISLFLYSYFSHLCFHFNCLLVIFFLSSTTFVPAYVFFHPYFSSFLLPFLK